VGDGYGSPGCRTPITFDWVMGIQPVELQLPLFGDLALLGVTSDYKIC